MKNPKLFELCSHDRDASYSYPCGTIGSDITLLDLLAGFALAGLMATPGNRKEIEAAAKITGERESVIAGKLCCGAAVSVLEELNKEREAREKRMKGAES